MTVTPGAADADGYATVDEFDTYATNRLPAVSWYATATDDQKEAALIAAARSLDACFEWTGAAVDATQAMCWPRTGMLTRNGFTIGSTTIPPQLKQAQCEFALQLGASDRLGDNDPLKKGIIGLKAGSVELRFSDAQARKGGNYESADVDIRRQQTDLNYVADVVPDEVRRLLVGSWFAQSSVKLAIIFDAN